MKIHYYSGWFDEALPARYLESLQNDVTNTRSLVLIWGCWGGDELVDFVKDSWLAPGGIVFDEYHLVDNRRTKEEAHRLIKQASVLLLLGGSDLHQAEFFKEYGLETPIRETDATIIMGFSAGAINMPSTCVSFEDGTTTVYEGLGLDNFCYLPYFSLEKHELAKNDYLPLLKEVDVYATAPESFIRTKGTEVAAFGEVYKISDMKMNRF
ncbi:MAG: Type 1 glutamine amidotransferase-like domain-containing protein [Defluviitaleaceae bacterium]|nr:Type 1 glutamine amidotransferase-like domain-containing protein [Defluviitaleaceae bacterium]